MLKKILHISMRSKSNCFSFFSSLKKFLMSLIMFAFSALKNVVKKKLFFFKSIKFSYIPYKKH